MFDNAHTYREKSQVKQQFIEVFCMYHDAPFVEIFYNPIRTIFADKIVHD